jgi:hypothetical protein
VALVVSTVHRLYAVEAASFEGARARVERVTGLELTRHDSSYLGEYFRFADVDGRELELHANHHRGEDAWLEPDHADAAYLVRVTSPADRDAWLGGLEDQPGIRLLRRTEF